MNASLDRGVSHTVSGHFTKIVKMFCPALSINFSQMCRMIDPFPRGHLSSECERSCYQYWGMALS